MKVIYRTRREVRLGSTNVLCNEENRLNIEDNRGVTSVPRSVYRTSAIKLYGNFLLH